MSHRFSLQNPLYMQVKNLIKVMIASGEWKAGAKLPEVDELSQAYGLNARIVIKALKELERSGLCVCDKTGAYYVTLAPQRIDNLRSELVLEEAHTFIESASSYGFALEDALRIISTEWKDGLPCQ